MAGQESYVIVDEKREVLGSVIRITVVADNGLEAKARNTVLCAFRECERLDQEYSRFRNNNQLSALNSTIGKWQIVSAELFFLLVEGEKIFRQTNGAFNLGVKSLLEKWGYDERYSFAPAEDKKISKNSVFDLQHPPYELKKNNLAKLFYSIELGGLGKGYALDLMKKELKNFQIFCIDAGGDLYAQGLPEVDNPWRMYFENPHDTSSVIGQVEVDGIFLAASNSLKRKWAKNYHHLVDPKSQKPADNMLGVYTQASSGILADAYSTALFALGYDEAKKRLPQLPVEAMLISPKGEIFRTDNFNGELFIV